MFNKVVKHTKMAFIAGALTVSFGAVADDIQFNIAVPEINAQTYILMD